MFENKNPYHTQSIMCLNYKSLIQNADLSLVNGGIFLTDNGGEFITTLDVA